MGHTPPSIVAGKYEILGRLGEGGQGSVWKVRHVELDQVRAMKWQPDEGVDDAASRFRREGLALARLRHPHIVEVFDFGRDADAHYLIMEYVEGQNLAQRFRTRGRPTLPDALEIARQVADALSYSHRQPYVDSQGRRHEGMIHRDIKPSNILLRDQVKMHALLADFGLVKLGDPGERTTTGAVMGTYKYSAPEQLGLRRGRERVAVDLRADVFAFGLVLYELLEGRQFHEGLDMGEVLGRVLYEDLEPEFEQPVSTRLRGLVTACIRRFPEDRPDRMDAVLREIEVAAAELRGEETQTHLVPHAELDLDEQIEVLLRERERRRVQTAQAAAQAARRDAAAVEAEALAGQIFGRGVEADDRAALALRNGDNTVAREGFEQAAELFAQAAAAAAAARQRREIDARAAGAAERRSAAEAAGAPADAAEAFERGRKLEDGALVRLGRGELDGVARDLAAAETEYASAARDASAARERRETKTTRLQLAESRRAADAVDASRLAAEAYRLANELETQGEAALGAGDLGAARDLYARSAAAFGRATTQATSERDRRRARVAHRDAERARAASEAAGAVEWASAEHQAAGAVLEDAEAAFVRDDHAAAIEAFARASEAFATAVDVARTRATAAARAQAGTVAAHARAARGGAVTGGVAAADLAAGDAALATADVLAGRDDFARAEGEYARARVLFEEALGAARRRGAESAARRAELAGRAALEEQADRGAPRAHADGQRELEHGREALAADRYEDAVAAFDRAAALFERAAAEARAARTQATDARGAARVAREAVAGVAGEFATDALAAADAVLREGDELLAAGDGGAAAARFVTARELFGGVGAQASTAREQAIARAREAVERARARAEAGRTVARDAGAAADAGRLIEEAASAFDAGQRAYEMGDLGAAERAFESAADAYARAATAAAELRARREAEALRRARDEAVRARGRAEAARERAQRTTARDDAPAELAAAAKHFSAAGEALERNDFATAAPEFAAAADAFGTAADLAEAAARAREAEAARLRAEAEEHARAAAEAKARDEAAARARAEAEAQARAEAEAAALEAERVARAEAEARARAAAEQRRADAMERRKRAMTAGAERDAARAFQEANARLGPAEGAFSAGRYDVAAEQFGAAGAAFDEAARQAAEARARAEAAAREQAERQATAARTRVETARRDAMAAGAPDDAASALAGADAERDAGAAALAGGDFVAATARFEAAGRGYDAAATSARTAAKARAEAARKAKEQAEAEARKAEAEARKAAAEARKAKERAEADARRARARADAEAARKRDEAERAKRAAEDDRTRASIGDADRTRMTRARSPEPPRPADDERTHVGGAAAEERTRVGGVAADDRTMREEVAAPVTPTVVVPELRRSGPSAAVLVGVAAVAVAIAGGMWMATRPSGPTPPATPGLRWARVTPDEARVAAREGSEVSLAVAVDGAPAPEVTYRWTLDGEPQQANGAAFAFTPDFAGRARSLEVGVVASRADQRVERRWTVDVADVGRPPRIESPAADETKVEVAAGAPVALEVRASDPDAADGDVITYRWERNGERIASATDPKLTLADGHDGDVIRVAAVDRDGLEARRTFMLAMKTEPAPPPSTAPLLVEHPPAIVELTPPPPALQLVEGASRTFRARATDPDTGDKVTYAWLVDGRKVATDATFELTAPTDARQKSTLAVQLQVADTTGHQVTRSWTVTVSAPRPRIVSVDPKAPEVTLKPGEARAFSAHATSERDGARIRYEWTLDDRALPGSGERVTLPTDLAPGRHTIVAVARDERDLASDARRWTATIKAEPPAAGDLTEAEAKRWLSQYQAAWEANDGDRLMALGVAANASEAERMTSGWGPREVRISSVSIQRNGPTAKIVFRRVDRDKRNDRELEFPAALTYELRRDGDRVRAVR